MRAAAKKDGRQKTDDGTREMGDSRTVEFAEQKHDGRDNEKDRHQLTSPSPGLSVPLKYFPE